MKDLSNTDFIKVINESHFAFFNQDYKGNNKFYSGGETHTYKENQYAETLSFTSAELIKNYDFLIL
ncbi:MAG: hypothetical protein ACJA1H_001315 [Glaciecola sp.]|jgi:hypothetical protein